MDIKNREMSKRTQSIRQSEVKQLRRDSADQQYTSASVNSTRLVHPDFNSDNSPVQMKLDLSNQSENVSRRSDSSFEEQKPSTQSNGFLDLE